MMKKMTRALIMLLTGGIIYFYFEILVRGYSHISMFLLGGVCFYIVGGLGIRVLNSSLELIMKLIAIMLISGLVITSLEFMTGMIVNVHMKLNVWNYSHMSFNYKGQVCALYSALWSVLGLPCVYIYGVIDGFVIEDEKKAKRQLG